MGIGSDIIEIGRIAEAHKKHGQPFLDRLFSKKEQEYCHKHKDPYPRFAGRFAAKEAIVKAIGLAVEPWSELEVINNSEGKPEVFLSQRLQEQFPEVDFLVTISHCRDYATATALLIPLGE